MATESIQSVDLSESDLHRYDDELGFFLLALAQLVSIFAVWFGLWPTQFGLQASVGYGFAGFFLASGMFGFYTSFRALSV